MDEPRYEQQACLDLVAAILSGRGGGGARCYPPFTRDQRLAWLRGQLPKTAAILELAGRL